MRKAVAMIGVILSVYLSLAVSALAASYTILESFDGSNGRSPREQLVQASSGVLYGTTSSGGNVEECSGNLGCGTVFTVDAEGNVTLLHAFTTVEGGMPSALVEGGDGNLYGTTSSHGAPPEGSPCVSWPYNGCGTIFRLQPDGSVTVLHQFTGLEGDGTGSRGGLVAVESDQFYGVGSSVDGAIAYRLSASGEFEVIHTFDEAIEGNDPLGPLALGADGLLYGSTGQGIFRMALDGTVTMLHPFVAAERVRHSPLVMGSDGAFYGTTEKGGIYGRGSIFRVDAEGAYTTLHSFDEEAAHGAAPMAPLSPGQDGALYGTTTAGGLPVDNPNRTGVIFKSDTAGNVTVLKTFFTEDGAYAQSAPIQAAGGVLYGTTFSGGPSYYGLLYRLDPNAPPTPSTLTFEPSNVSGGNPATGTVHLDAPAPAGGALVALESSDPQAAEVPDSVLIAAGERSATFPVTTSLVDEAANVTITATYNEGSVSAPFSVLPLYLSDVQINPELVAETGPASVFISLSDTAGTGGVEVTLESSNPAIAPAPPSALVPAGELWIVVPITTTEVSESEMVTVTVSFDGTSIPAAFYVAPREQVNLYALGTGAPGVEGGFEAYAAVLLEGGAPAGGALVTLESSHPELTTMPESVLVAPGETMFSFPVTTTRVTEWVDVVLSATYQGITRSADLTIMTPIEDFGLDTPEAEAGQEVGGRVSLSLPAPEGGAEVALTSSDPALASAPASVYIPEGEKDAAFTIITHDVDAPTTVQVTSSYHGDTRTASLSVRPAGAGWSVRLPLLFRP